MSDTPLITGTELFESVVSYDYGDFGRSELMREVWSVTPWMVNFYIGRHSEARDIEVRAWCVEHFGPEALPIHGRPGNWQRGNATINGWTWMGFASEDMLVSFLAAWNAKENGESHETTIPV